MLCRQFATFVLGAVVVALPRRESACAISLLQLAAKKNDSVPGNVGMSATLDESGYQQVVEAGKLAQSHEMMSAYAKRICEHHGLNVTDQKAFDAFLKYFDGACSSQSFEALSLGLHDATSKPRACGGGWVATISPDSTMLGQTHAKEKSLTEKEGVALLSVHHDVSHEARLHAEITGIFQKLHDLLFRTGSNETISSNADSKRKEKQLFSNEMESAPVGVEDNQTQIAPDQVDEHAYQAIAQSNSSRMMVAFMHDILRVYGLTMTDQARLLGMAPWYTAECGPQTVAALRRELYRFADESSAPGNEVKSGHPHNAPSHCDDW